MSGPALWPRLYQALVHYRQEGASDLHVVGGCAVYPRLDGDLLPPMPSGYTPNDDEIEIFLRDVCTEYQYAQFKNVWTTDAAYGDAQIGRIRINASCTATGTALALRYLQDEPPDFPTLGLPPIIAQWTHKPSGLILFSGVTGSGKTTLQASLLRYMLQMTSPRVLTLEDPIEYLFADPRVSQHELGRHFISFEDELAGFMRRDPDVIMMGEIRSRATAESLLLAAESGHLAMATVHSSDTARVFDRILGMFQEDARDLIRVQLAQQLIGIVGLKLVKRKQAPNGKSAGRRAACEILVKNDAIAAAIVNGKKARDIRDAVTNTPQDGMRSLESFLSELVRNQEIDLETARDAAERPEELTVGR